MKTVLFENKWIVINKQHFVGNKREIMQDVVKMQ
jgi:hypothetical protein